MNGNDNGGEQYCLAGEESVAVVSNFSSTFAEVIEEEVQVNQAIPQQQETQTQQQNPEQRKLAVDSDGTTFDFSRLFPFLPKTTGSEFYYIPWPMVRNRKLVKSKLFGS